MARPSKFSEAIANRICERLADGESLRAICCDKNMPGQTTVFRWLAADEHDAFRKQYAHARETQADSIFDEILDIADNGANDWMERHEADNEGWKENGEAIRRSQLRIDARKWMAGKLRPKVYGDRQAVDLNLDMSDEAKAWLGQTS